MTLPEKPVLARSTSWPELLATGVVLVAFLSGLVITVTEFQDKRSAYLLEEVRMNLRRLEQAKARWLASTATNPGPYLGWVSLTNHLPAGRIRSITGEQYDPGLPGLKASARLEKAIGPHPAGSVLQAETPMPAQ